MSILGSAMYQIRATFFEEENNRTEIHTDNFDNLRRVIATTWGKIPHEVKVSGKMVYVYNTEGKTLAHFEFTPFKQLTLPDHF